MQKSYEDVLKRLKEERKRLGLSQMEISRCVHMNQSDYCKVEAGQRLLSYYELQELSGRGVDLYYVYSGWKVEAAWRTVFEGAECEELLGFLRILFSVEGMHGRGSQKEECGILDEIRYVPLIGEKFAPGLVLIALRRQLDYRQIKMAEALGVDVKKLRDLENGKRLPDAELLFRLYQKYNVSPCVMLRDKNGMIAEIAGILERMDNREKALLTDFFLNILDAGKEKDIL